MQINLTYCLSNKLVPDDYLQVLGYYGLSAKNIKNSALFIINNIFSSYQYNKESDSYWLKSNLHDNQTEILNFTNQTIKILNKKLKDKFDKNKDKSINSKIKEPKLSQFKLYDKIIDKTTYYQILDKSLLENSIKVKEELKPEFKDYSLVHSHLSQSVVHKLCDEFQYYFKALKSFSKNKDNFTAKPKQPDYKPKTSSISFDVSSQRFTKNGQILLIGKNHKIYQDYDKTKLINKDLVDKFNSFNLLDAIKQDIKNKNLDGKDLDNEGSKDLQFNITQIRIIPGKYKQQPKIEYVLSYEKELKGFYPDLLAKAKENGKDFFKLKDNYKLELIKEYFNKDYLTLNPSNPTPYVMGIDCGLVNFAAISIFNKNKDFNYVVSGRALKRKITKIDTKLDQHKSNLTTQEIRNLQSKKDSSQQLTRPELIKLKEFYKDLSFNNELVKLQLRKSNITQDFLHKLSKSLVEDCLKKEIKVMVVGKNKGQKNEINLGNKNNRAMYNFPHARFIEILKYKAMINDILVIVTEESYTSKTSFIDNEQLAEYNKTTQGNKSPLLGKRRNQSFITRNKIKIHADINGSFNIIRKVLTRFSYDKTKINLSYNLVELNLSGKKKLKTFFGPLAKSCIIDFN